MKKSHIIIASVGVVLAGATILLLTKKKDKNTGGSEKVKCKGDDCEEKEVIVPAQVADLIGKKVNTDSKFGFTHVRKSAVVDGDSYCVFDLCYLTGNVVAKVEDNPVGTIIDGKVGSDSYLWFKVKLDSPVEGVETGWVREDAVSY
jgi:hypothetical protein